jgi:lipopolysaccharide export system protein LptC
MIDSTQYCSILCCVKDTTNQRTETSNYDVDDPDEEIVIDEHVAMYRSAPTTTGRRIRHARKQHRQRKSSPIRSFVL